MLRIEHNQQTISSHSGPMPDRETMETYERLCPGATDRLLATFEKEQSHRHELKSREMALAENHLKAIMRRSWGGLIFGFAIALVAIGCAYALGIAGVTTVASILGGGTVLGLASAFISGKLIDHKKLEDAE